MKNILLLLLACFTVCTTMKAEQNIPQQVIVFDFGGVIVKPDKAMFYDFIQDTFQVDDETLKQIRDDFRAVHDAKIPEDLFWRQMAIKFNISLPRDWKIQYDTVLLHALNEIKEMRDLVKFYKAQGYRVALLSNVQPQHAIFLRENGYYNDFSPVLLSCEIGVDKPDPRAYQILLSEVQVAPENCIFIDDKPENVKAAKALGIDAILFTDPKQVREELSLRLEQRIVK
jgi:putative hydrolase of the HAD superfamily